MFVVIAEMVTAQKRPDLSDFGALGAVNIGVAVFGLSVR